MTYYEVKRVPLDPDTAFQAACSACDRLELRPVAIHPEARVALYARGLHFKRGSIGEYITVRAWRGKGGTVIGAEGTPYLGPWSRATVDRLLDTVVDEIDLVVAAPEARMRDVVVSPRLRRPFGNVPRALALVELLAALLFWGVLTGGALGTFATIMAATNTLLVFIPHRGAVWRGLSAATAWLNLPTGLIGIVAGRRALAQALWPKAPQGPSATRRAAVPVVPAPGSPDEAKYARTARED